MFEEEEDDVKRLLLKVRFVSVTFFTLICHIYTKCHLLGCFPCIDSKATFSVVLIRVKIVLSHLPSQSSQAIAPASIAPPVCTEYPADWSLKTRVLFTSPLSLLWAEHPRAQEEALGLSHHCRAQFSTLPLSVQVQPLVSLLHMTFQILSPCSVMFSENYSKATQSLS